MEKVKLDTGFITGSEVKQAGCKIYIYRGVPYAAPPAGDFRWKPPQPASPWSGVMECTKYSIQAAQYQDPAMKRIVPSSEDCLYLNIYTPTQDKQDKLPVMVWLHGGGLRAANGNMPTYNNLGLPRHGVVQVNVNHRLGIMGLFSHPLLTKESPNHSSGDYMFLDMIAALQWVQRNITAFGGDPNNVTIFGESGGGLKVATLMASPLASGLFHRAVIESGGRVFDTSPLEKIEKYGEKFFQKLGIDKNADPLAAARALPWKTIVDKEQEFSVELGPDFVFRGAFNIIHEGWFLPDALINMFQTGKRNQVPFLVVANKGELTGPGMVIADTMIKDYLRLLTGKNTAKSKGYAAIFDQVPQSWKQDGCVAAHGMEQSYLFDALDDNLAWNEVGGYSSAGAKSSMPVISQSDREVSENMERIWTTFAKTGNPSVKGLIEWPAWDSKTDKYLLITDPLQIKQGFSELQNIKPDRSAQAIF